jgi:hypothetical protein
MDWRGGSSSRVLEFKPQSHQKKSKTRNKTTVVVVCVTSQLLLADAQWTLLEGCLGDIVHSPTAYNTLWSVGLTPGSDQTFLLLVLSV